MFSSISPTPTPAQTPTPNLPSPFDSATPTTTSSPSVRGKEIWRLLDFNMGLSIAYGYIVTGNEYDNNVYCIGKGSSTITVTAPQSGISMGSSFTISGTVTDQSPGVVAIARKMGYINGIPCVLDTNQQAWMEYLYEQQPKPINAQGVTVSINVIDSNGNYRQIGTTTSDLSGTFAFTWTPDIPGDFTVIANFDGSNSYGPSSAETHFTVGNAAPTTSPIAETIQQPTEMYIIGVGAAIIIAIAIVGVALALMIKKRP